MLVSVVAILLAMGPSQENRPTEYQVKAAFLYQFAKFVEWPPESFSNAESQLVLCVIGADPFGDTLQEMVRGKTVNGRPLALQKHADGGGANNCHIAFLPTSQARAVLQGARRRHPWLTVGESEQFLAWGGIINFVIEDNRVRFEINPDAAEQAGLRMSSKLLALARIVHDPARRK
jgi:hypothetical protein